MADKKSTRKDSNGKPILSARTVVKDYFATTQPDDRDSSSFSKWLSDYRKDLSAFAITTDKTIRNYLTSIGYARLAAF